jgi:hypothetical protein
MLRSIGCVVWIVPAIPDPVQVCLDLGLDGDFHRVSPSSVVVRVDEPVGEFRGRADSLTVGSHYNHRSEQQPNACSHDEASRGEQEIAIQRAEGQSAIGRIVDQSRYRGTNHQTGCRSDGTSEERPISPIARGAEPATGSNYMTRIQR